MPEKEVAEGEKEVENGDPLLGKRLIREEEEGDEDEGVEKSSEIEGGRDPSLPKEEQYNYSHLH